jgi:dTDP-4-amino-4,6-dideoxygalactose transaminase
MTDSSKIPFLDLIAPHKELKEHLSGVVVNALEAGAFIGGPMLDGFERDFATFCETGHCAGVGSGTDALRFVLIAAGIGPGAMVLTVPNTFIATTEAISQAGARPAFVDIDERTYNMDPRKLAEYLEFECQVDPVSGAVISRKLELPVKAIVPVHLYGQPADMDAILELAERYRLIVIEDACQAHGASYFSRRENRWRKVGSMGLAAAFSFYPGKNLGACGEAGAVTTNDAAIAQKVRMLRDHGQNRKYYHEVEGYNGRLDAIQAGILAAKLKLLAQWNAARREAAARYGRFFAEAGAGELVPFEPGWAKVVYHLYVIRVRDRDGLIRHLAEANIGAGIHYPVPLHLQKAYERLGYCAGDFPIAERVASEIVSLPMFPQLTGEQQIRVIEAVQSFRSAGILAGVGRE